MPRIARVVAPGFPHHITQRGNQKQDVFESHGDREWYLSLIDKYCKKYQLSMVVYCLMKNHVHFIAIPEEHDTLARVFNTTHMRYTQYINKMNGLSGHLWHGRFFSCVMDDLHFLNAARYVERNPVRAGLVKYPWEWQWSSAGFHCGKIQKSDIKLADFFSFIDMDQTEWLKFIKGKDDQSFVAEIKKFTLAGRPFAREETVKILEKKAGRSLRLRSSGRPRKRR